MITYNYKNFIFLIGTVIVLTSCQSSRIVSNQKKNDKAMLATNKVDNRPMLADDRFIIPFKVYPMDIKSDESSEIARQVTNKLKQLYESRDNQPIWITNRGPKPVYYEMIRQLNNSAKHGLDSSIYQISRLEQTAKKLLTEAFMVEDLIAFEKEISRVYLTYCYHIANGTINPHKINPYWHIDDRNLKMVKNLSRITKPNHLRKFEESLYEENESYVKMMNWLTRYRQISHSGGWSRISIPEETIEPHSEHHLVPEIRKRLVLEYSYLDTTVSTQTYDLELQQAVRDFQERHGLIVDARIGSSTIEALNIPAEERIETIKLNLERQRWLPKKYSDNLIMVNIPSYELNVYKKNKKKLEMAVITGKDATQTPIFSDTLKYMVFSPTWTIPESIKTQEMLPRLQKDSSHYSGRNYKFYKGWSTTEVDPETIDWQDYSVDYFPFNVVQQPGPSNALGLVKFIMPNDMSIYLHDTPTDYLFDRNKRALSHGCVRLEQPAELAYYLLKKRGWDRQEIYEAMRQDEPQKVILDKGYHVQITYLTSFVDDKGRLHFREDVYGHDQPQLRHISKLTSSRL